MLKLNQTLHKLRRGETAYGTSIDEFPLPGTVTILQQAGWDFCHICCEHTSTELTQIKEMIEIRCCSLAYGNQAVLQELRGLNKQSALLSRIICRGEADGFRDAQPASVEEMVENVARSKPE